MSYYEVCMDGKKIYDPSYKEMSLLNPVVSMGAGEAGSFDFVFPKNHIYVNSIIPYGSTIEVFEDGNSIFYGRPLPPSIDIYNQKTVHCEGALAFLNDVICPSGASGTASERNDGQYYQFLLNYYNSQQARNDRKIRLGSVPTGGVSRIHDWTYRSCMDEMRNNVLPYTGGILLTRRANGNTYVDWVNSFANTANQPIEIGLNLLDATRTGQQFYTMAIAVGGKDADGNAISMQSPVYLSSSICGKYGNICAYLEFPTVTSVSALQGRCLTFLNKQQFNSFSFEANAIDLHISNSEYDRLVIGKKINVRFNDVEEVVTMPITKININIATGKKTITVSAEDWTEKKQYVKNEISSKSLTEIQVNNMNSISDLDSLPDFSEIQGTDLVSYDGTTLNLTDTTTNKQQAITISTEIDPITGEETKIISITDMPDGLVIRKKYGEYYVGDTIEGDLIRRTPEGVETELDSYTYLVTDIVTVVHSNGVIDQYGTGQEPFIFYYGDTLSIVTAEGDTITFRTYETDFQYEAGDLFDSDDYDAFYEYGNGTEELVNSSLIEFNIEDGYEFEGTNEDPVTVTATVKKTSSTTKTKEISIDSAGNITGAEVIGSVDLKSTLSDTIDLAVDGQGVYVTRIDFTQVHGKYEIGDIFHSSDYIVMATFSDETLSDVTNECSFSIDDEYRFTGSGDPANLAATWTSEIGDDFVALTPIVVGETMPKIGFIKINDVEYDLSNWASLTFDSYFGHNFVNAQNKHVVLLDWILRRSSDGDQKQAIGAYAVNSDGSCFFAVTSFSRDYSFGIREWSEDGVLKRSVGQSGFYENVKIEYDGDSVIILIIYSFMSTARGIYPYVPQAYNALFAFLYFKYYRN